MQSLFSIDMQIKVKLFGGLKIDKSYNTNEDGDYILDIPISYKVFDLIEDFSLTNKPLIVVINNIICNDYSKPLKEGDSVSFFPPIAGG